MKRIFTLFLLIACATILKAQVTNQAVSFAGDANSKIAFGNIAEVNGVSRFTFEAWVYIDQWKENSYIFSKMGSVANRIDIQLGAADKKRLFFHVSNNGNSYAALDNSSITVGKWHHLAMAYDGTQAAYKMIEVFIDGVKVTPWYSSGNGTLPATTPSTSAGFELGTNGFAGKIDEARLWDTNLAVTDLELKNTINKYHHLYNNLVAYWKMDQNNSVIVDYKSSYHGMVSNASLIVVTNNSAFKYRIVSSYIRSNFYESGAISEESLLNNNDIIYLAANPYADGEVFFEYPINDGVTTNAVHLGSFAGRSGVMDFAGAGSVMNGGKDLLNRVNAGIATFTFASWVYVDQWTSGSYIFRKFSSASNTIDLQLGDEPTNTLVIHLSNGGDNYAMLSHSGLVPGEWHHIAVTYTGSAAAGQQVKIYVDGVSKGLTYKNSDNLLPRTGPFIRSDFELGVNFDGKLDETSLNLLSLGAAEINSLKNGPLVVKGWNFTKTNAYWKFDDPSSPGKDSRTWVNVLDSLKAAFSNQSGAKIRLGFSGGSWQAMVGNATARTNFASHVNALLQQYDLDGVDLDFEWPATTTEWTNYSNAIVTLKNALPSEQLFTVSLHPLYYRLSTASIAAVDYISLQCYGPSPNRFPYNQMVTDINTVLSYGIPKEKLVLGLPFYATTSDNSGTTSYANIVAVYPNLNPDLDQVPITLAGQQKTAVFNGQTTITRKTRSTQELDLLGVMYWDLATDISYTNDLSLLRSLNRVMNANVEPVAYTSIGVQTISFLPIETKEMGTPDFDAGATASSGLPVTYSSSYESVATIENGKIHLVGAGTTVITASQKGNGTVLPAVSVTRTLTVVKKSQAITFGNLSQKVMGDADFGLMATATSGLPVSYTSSNTAVASIANGTVHITGAGTTIITAVQEGNELYGAANAVTQELVVIADKEPPTIPSSLTASATDETVTLTWMASTDFIGVVGYNVYKDGQLVNAALVTDLTYSVGGLHSFQTCTFSVVSIDAAGNRSVPTTITVKTPDTKAPSAPSLFSGDKITGHRVELSWQSSTDNVGVTGYFIYRNGVRLNTIPVRGNNFVAERPFGKDVYVFTVKAGDDASNLSGASNSVTVANGVVKELVLKANGSHYKEVEISNELPGLSVYPNPSGGNFSVVVNNMESGVITLKVYNSAGVLVHTVKDTKYGEYRKEFKLHGHAAGVYYMQISINGLTQTKNIGIR